MVVFVPLVSITSFFPDLLASSFLPFIAFFCSFSVGFSFLFLRISFALTLLLLLLLMPLRSFFFHTFLPMRSLVFQFRRLLRALGFHGFASVLFELLPHLFFLYHLFSLVHLRCSVGCVLSDSPHVLFPRLCLLLRDLWFEVLFSVSLLLHLLLLLLVCFCFSSVLRCLLLFVFSVFCFFCMCFPLYSSSYFCSVRSRTSSWFCWASRRRRACSCAALIFVSFFMCSTA